MQDPPYRHAGMIQHNLDGDLQFLHRTAWPKFDPTSPEPWRKVNFVSNPLTAQQATIYAPGLTFSSDQVTMEFDKHCCTRQATLKTPALGCNLKLCTTPGNPLPVLAVSVDSLDHRFRSIIKQQEHIFSAMKANFSARSPQPV